MAVDQRQHSRGQEHRARGRGRAKGTGSGRGAAGYRSRDRGAAASPRRQTIQAATTDEEVDLSRLPHSPGTGDGSPSASVASPAEWSMDEVDDVSS